MSPVPAVSASGSDFLRQFSDEARVVSLFSRFQVANDSGSKGSVVLYGPAMGDEPVSDPTREEIDAKLETVEARTRGLFIELGGKLDRVLDSNAALSLTVTRELGKMEADLKDARSEVKRDNNFTRWTIGIAVVTSMLAAVGALWVTQGNLLSAFQAVLAAVHQ